MIRSILLGVGVLAISAYANGQTTLLTESFDSGTIPPAGWLELNNGVSLGWEPDSSGLQAWHDDFHGANDNSLLSPAFDGSTVSEMYLHGLQAHNFPTWRDLNLVQVTLDGGLTFTTVYSEGTTDTGSMPLEANLSSYAGSSGIQVSFRFIGDFANEWFLDNVIIDDVAPPPPPPNWIHLPTTFFPAFGFRENFESLAGGLPSHMALNALNSDTRLDDAEAWCNVGQLGATMHPYDGTANLEMGLLPGSTNYHYVSNAIILGLNGGGASNLHMTFQAMHHGEEVDGDDGVFVSTDGLYWEPVVTDWGALAGNGVYQFVTCDLGSTTIDISGDFYLAISQEDNFPYADLDGVAIDNVTVNCPVYTISNLVAGGVANFDIAACTPGSFVYAVYSRTPGPTATPYGMADVGSPYTVIGSAIAGGAGFVSLTENIPAGATGFTVWTQALELTPTTARFSNGMVVTVL